jgi:hypothetical protein
MFQAAFYLIPYSLRFEPGCQPSPDGIPESQNSNVPFFVLFSAPKVGLLPPGIPRNACNCFGLWAFHNIWDPFQAPFGVASGPGGSSPTFGAEKSTKKGTFEFCDSGIPSGEGWQPGSNLRE